MPLCKDTVWNVSSIPSRQDHILYPPVTSSLTSASIDFLNSRSKAGIPPTFFIAILFSSVDLPNTRFRRAPQAFFWTSKTLWSNRSTRCLIPPSLYTWNEKNNQVAGLRGTQNTNSSPSLLCWGHGKHLLQTRRLLPKMALLSCAQGLARRGLALSAHHTHQAWHFHRRNVWSTHTMQQTQRQHRKGWFLDLVLQAALLRFFPTWESSSISLACC